MRILADLHHHDLYHSLQLLFEKRLGWELYRPIGMEWKDEGFWGVFNHPQTARQYLEIRSTDTPWTKDFGDDAWINKTSTDLGNGIYLVGDHCHTKPLPHKGIRLETFKNMHFDIVLSSIPKHIPMFKRLIKEFQPHAKHIFQAGNNFGGVPVANILTSSKRCHSTEPKSNEIHYHQEFELDIFYPGPCSNTKSVTNLQHYMNKSKWFHEFEAKLPDWNFKALGAGNRDGPAVTTQMADTIKEAGFIWHVKTADEGYGYNIHHSMACGRPMIVGAKYQRNCTAEDLYLLDQTVIDVSEQNHTKALKTLQDAEQNWDEWSARCYNRFKEVVDFDDEFEKIKVFLDNLI